MSRDRNYRAKKKRVGQFTENVHAEVFVLSLQITQMAHNGYKNSQKKMKITQRIMTLCVSSPEHRPITILTHLIHPSEEHRHTLSNSDDAHQIVFLSARLSQRGHWGGKGRWRVGDT